MTSFGNAEANSIIKFCLCVSEHTDIHISNDNSFLTLPNIMVGKYANCPSLNLTSKYHIS